jgi:hypothetical protein
MKPLWQQAWSDPGWRRSLYAGLLVALPVVYYLPAFFWFIEHKPGFTIYDPVLARIGPAEVSGLTFGVLYSLVVAGIIRLMRDPWRFVRMLHAYALLLLMRMLTIYTVTLEPPGSIIPLVDPVTQGFYPEDEPFLKDLFFSGHTSTSVLFAIAVGRGWLRKIIGVGAAVVGFLVILQHVHYTIDVLVAPFFAWLVWQMARWTMRACGVDMTSRESHTRQHPGS